MNISRYFFVLQNIFRLCSQQEKMQIGILLIMMVIGAVLEVIGIGIIIPFIAVLSNPQLISKYPALMQVQELTGLEGEQQLLFLIGCTLLFVYIIKNGFLGLLVHFQSKFLFNKQAELAKSLLRQYMKEPYTFHLQKDSSNLLRNITQEAMNAINGVVLPFLSLLTEGFVLVFIIGFLMIMEPLVASVTLAILFFIGFVILKVVSKSLAKHGENRMLYAGEMIKWVSQGLGGIKESKILGREEYFVNAFNNSSLKYVVSARHFALLSVAPRLMIEAAVVSIMLVAVLIVLAMGNKGAEIFTVLALFAVAAVRLMPSLNRVVASANAMRFFLPSLSAVLKEIGDLKETQESSISPMDKTMVFEDAVVLKDVSFRYPGIDDDVLHGISMRIPRGASIAFAGPSGAGKSTLVDLLLGLQTPTEGTICIDSKNLSGVRVDWQRKIGYVPQSIYLLDGTIRQNIAFGIPDDQIDEICIKNSIQLAQLDKKIKSLPKGLDTMVGENGVRLSGGERQRIGIARSLYHQPEVIIFDEATSALDNETEKEISQTINSLMGKRTVLIIAHRLSTIKGCDKIQVLKNGKQVESGSYDTLMALDGVFRSMVEVQES